MNLLVFTFFYSLYSTTAEKKDGQSKVDVIEEEEANEETEEHFSSSTINIALSIVVPTRNLVRYIAIS